MVDGIGAGDAFLGTFAAAFAEGLPVEIALLRAAAAGALAVGRRGAYAALPTRAEVDAAVKVPPAR
jgi:ribokinase